MSELAFDANGEPIAFPAEAEELRVRRFRNPGMRGACEVVHDRDGAPLYVPVDTGYVEFRKLVDGVPGRYRLDPTDSARRVIANSMPAYVTLSEGARSQAAASGGDDRECVIRELARANADMAKTIADRFASVMHAAADLLRAADGAGLPRREPPPPVPTNPAPEPEEEEEDDDLDDDEEEEEESELGSLIAQVLPMIQMWLASKAAEKSTAATSAAAPASVPVPAQEAAPAATPSTETGEAGAAARPTAHSGSPTSSGDGSAGEPPAGATVRNAGVPSAAQTGHLMGIYARLVPDEKRVAELVVMRMTPEMRAQWLEELSALSIEQAVELVRSMIPKLQGRKERDS